MAENLPALTGALAAGRAPILGAIYTLGGVAHFTAHDAYTSMYPKPGSWGLWYLPGSASFHVNWTGVAEILGGGALLATSLLPGAAESLPSLQPSAALALFWLTVAITPANIYMFTHNAPGPVPEPVPLTGHLFRLVMQIVLLSAFWEMAHP